MLRRCAGTHTAPVLSQTAERRDALKKEQPDIAFGEMGKVMGSEWRAMSEAKKAPYEKKAEAAKASEFCAETHRYSSCSLTLGARAEYAKAKAAYDAKNK